MFFCQQVNIFNIVEIHSGKVNISPYLCFSLRSFQPIAVEVFSGDGRNYLLAFQKGIRNKVYQRYWFLGTLYNAVMGRDGREQDQFS